MPVLAPVDESGVYIEGYDWLTGQHVADIARPIFESLKREGLLLSDRVLRARLPALLALQDRADLPPGGRVVHLDGQARIS